MMCAGAIVQFNIPRVVINDAINFGGNEAFHPPDARFYRGEPGVVEPRHNGVMNGAEKRSAGRLPGQA